MPIGLGKSLACQVVGSIIPGLALIIHPSAEVAADQVRSLLERGIQSSCLNSSLSSEQQDTVMEQALKNAYNIMYVSPEYLTDPQFQSFIQKIRISFIVVDEANCISQFSYNYKPSCKIVLTFLNSFFIRPPIVALTDMATPAVHEDIIDLLSLNDPFVYAASPDRANLHFTVERCTAKIKNKRILSYIWEHRHQSGIVYCSTKEFAEQVYRSLVELGVSVTLNHKGLTVDERQASLDDFITDYVNILVTTELFNVQVCKPDIRFVVHYNMPYSLEKYWQEIECAGRDGLPTECLLLCGGRDLFVCQFQIDHSPIDKSLSGKEVKKLRSIRREMLNSMICYGFSVDCSRNYLLNYFGESRSDPCGCCGNCDNNYVGIPVTSEVKAIISCVKELKRECGRNAIAEILRGSEKARKEGYPSLSCFGALALDSIGQQQKFFLTEEELADSAVPTRRIREIIDCLVAMDYLELKRGAYPTIVLGKRAAEVDEKGFSLTIKQNKMYSEIINPHPLRERRIPDIDTSNKTEQEKALYEHLRGVRNSIAHSMGSAPCVVFSNAALWNICDWHPQTLGDFFAIPGIERRKIKLYGNQFLRAIRKFEHP